MDHQFSANIMCYDSTHVQAVINQIDGYTHDRTKHPSACPRSSGTNFQAVSVGRKAKVRSGHRCGWPVIPTCWAPTECWPTPGPSRSDDSLGKMLKELK